MDVGRWVFLVVVGPSFFFSFSVLSLSMRVGVWSGVPRTISLFPFLHRLVGSVASLLHVENLFKVVGLSSFNV